MHEAFLSGCGMPWYTSKGAKHRARPPWPSTQCDIQPLKLYSSFRYITRGCRGTHSSDSISASYNIENQKPNESLVMPRSWVLRTMGPFI